MGGLIVWLEFNVVFGCFGNLSGGGGGGDEVCWWGLFVGVIMVSDGSGLCRVLLFVCLVFCVVMLFRCVGVWGVDGYYVVCLIVEVSDFMLLFWKF